MVKGSARIDVPLPGDGKGFLGRLGDTARKIGGFGLDVLEAAAPVAGAVADGLAARQPEVVYQQYNVPIETTSLADINAQYRALQQQIDADSQQQYQRWRDLQDDVNQSVQPLEIPQFTASVPVPQELKQPLPNPSLAGLQQQWQQNGVFNRTNQQLQSAPSEQSVDTATNPLVNQIFGNPFAPKQSSPQFVQPNQVPYRISQPYQPRFSVPVSASYRKTTGDILRRGARRGATLAQQRLIQQQLWQNSAYRQGSLNHNAVEQLEKGETISDKGLAQLEHAFDIAIYKTSDLALRAAIEQQKKAIIATAYMAVAAEEKGETLNELLSLSNKTKDGYVVLGMQAYGSKQAETIFRHAKGKYPNPLPYPTNPNLDKRHYPDVTKRVNSLLKQIEQEINPVRKDLLKLKDWFEYNFGNNSKWDLQVNHSLPGQAPLIQNGKYVRDKEGNIITKDQYALFEDRIVRAGYISNYAFGYAAAHALFPEWLPIAISHYYAIKGEKDGDNPADIDAIKDGWYAYWKKFNEG